MKLPYAPSVLPLAAALIGALVLALAPPAQAREGREDREDRGGRPPPHDRREHGEHRRVAPAYGPGHGAERRLDSHHAHNRYYPQPGWVVRTLPGHAHRVVWRSTPYWFWDGIWYRSGPHGHVVVRAPVGVRVHALPAFYTVLTLAGLTYLYANGEYYREHPQGGYEVVAPPPAAQAPAEEKLFVYPRNGQSAQQQAADEYECHRWAAQQTGFDPAAAATGQASAGQPQARAEYGRARTACLDARGYSAR